MSKENDTIGTPEEESDRGCGRSGRLFRAGIFALAIGATALGGADKARAANPVETADLGAVVSMLGENYKMTDLNGPDREIKIGAIQDLLRGFGLSAGTNPAAYDGLTKAGVKALQKKLGLSQDGWFGPGTKVAMERYLKRNSPISTPVVQIPARSEPKEETSLDRITEEGKLDNLFIDAVEQISSAVGDDGSIPEDKLREILSPIGREIETLGLDSTHSTLLNEIIKLSADSVGSDIPDALNGQIGSLVNGVKSELKNRQITAVSSRDLYGGSGDGSDPAISSRRGVAGIRGKDGGIKKTSDGPNLASGGAANTLEASAGVYQVSGADLFDEFGVLAGSTLPGEIEYTSKDGMTEKYKVTPHRGTFYLTNSSKTFTIFSENIVAEVFQAAVGGTNNTRVRKLWNKDAFGGSCKSPDLRDKTIEARYSELIGKRVRVLVSTGIAKREIDPTVGLGKRLPKKEWIKQGEWTSVIKDIWFFPGELNRGSFVYHLWAEGQDGMLYPLAEVDASGNLVSSNTFIKGVEDLFDGIFSKNRFKKSNSRTARALSLLTGCEESFTPTPPAEPNPEPAQKSIYKALFDRLKCTEPLASFLAGQKNQAGEVVGLSLETRLAKIRTLSGAAQFKAIQKLIRDAKTAVEQASDQVTIEVGAEKIVKAIEQLATNIQDWQSSGLKAKEIAKKITAWFEDNFGELSCPSQVTPQPASPPPESEPTPVEQQVVEKIREDVNGTCQGENMGAYATGGADFPDGGTISLGGEYASTDFGLRADAAAKIAKNDKWFKGALTAAVKNFLAEKYGWIPKGNLRLTLGGKYDDSVGSKIYVGAGVDFDNKPISLEVFIQRFTGSKNKYQDAWSSGIGLPTTLYRNKVTGMAIVVNPRAGVWMLDQENKTKKFAEVSLDLIGGNLRDWEWVTNIPVLKDITYNLNLAVKRIGKTTDYTAGIQLGYTGFLDEKGYGLMPTVYANNQDQGVRLSYNFDPSKLFGNSNSKGDLETVGDGIPKGLAGENERLRRVSEYVQMQRYVWRINQNGLFQQSDNYKSTTVQSGCEPLIRASHVKPAPTRGKPLPAEAEPKTDNSGSASGSGGGGAGLPPGFP